MDYEQLKDLIDRVDQSSLREFELKYADTEVRMSKNKHPLVQQNRTQPDASGSGDTERQIEDQAHTEQKQISNQESAEEKKEGIENEPSPSDAGHIVASPIVGVVYLSPAPGEPLFVSEGDQVSEGDTLCIVEAMKVMNEMKSDVSGIVKKVIAKDKAAVEYDQPLFIIQTEE